jgi:hypothetical protein
MTGLPQWVRPQLTQLVGTAPEGDQWLHEIKYDGYRMHENTTRSCWREAHSATPSFLQRCVVAPSRSAGYQNRQFKPKLNTVAPVSYEPIKMPADGLAE